MGFAIGGPGWNCLPPNGADWARANEGGAKGEEDDDDADDAAEPGMGGEGDES